MKTKLTFDELIDSIGNCPSMYTGNDNCRDVFLLISGINIGIYLETGTGPLEAFPKWLDLQEGEPSLIWWMGRLSDGNASNKEKLAAGIEKIKAYREQVHKSSVQEIIDRHKSAFSS